MTTDRIAAATERRVRAYIAEHQLLTGVHRLVVGFSGGPDSTALLLLAAEIHADCEAIHFNHGLRGRAAEEDAVWCRAFCRQKGIRFQATKLPVARKRRQRESIEMAARRLRLEHWRTLLGEDPTAAAALGHHLDDKIENFFLRLMRGSNAGGVTGLRNLTTINGVKFLRPLLCLRRADILAYLQACGVEDYRHDASNDDQRLTRNRIRHRLLPVLREFQASDSGVISSLELIEQDARFIESAAATHSSGERLAAQTLRDIDSALWPRLLRKWMRTAYGLDLSFRGSVIRELSLRVAANPCGSFQIDVDKSFVLQCDRGRFAMAPRDRPELSSAIPWNWRSTPGIDIPDVGARLSAREVDRDAWRDFANCSHSYWEPSVLSNTLIIRPRYPGDRMIPFGQNCPVRVKKLIGNARLTMNQKRRLFLVCRDDRTVLWIPAVRRGNIGRLDDSCKTAIELSCRFDAT